MAEDKNPLHHTLENWLKEKKGGRVHLCPVCDSPRWAIMPKNSGLITLDGTMMEFGKYYPTIIIQCSNCAHMQFFDVAAMGVTPEKFKEIVSLQKDKSSGI
ncbi:MAG: hypothetical protein ACR2PF_21655 [Rhizobiaceae bacterium]